MLFGRRRRISTFYTTWHGVSAMSLLRVFIFSIMTSPSDFHSNTSITVLVKQSGNTSVALLTLLAVCHVFPCTYIMQRVFDHGRRF
jgi:hypothetical protein